MLRSYPRSSLEKRSTTIATAHFCIHNTINELKKIAHLTQCVCLRNNCYHVINIINEKLSAEFVLARTAFSLTVDGRNYYHEFAFGDGREIELFKSYEAQHQRIKNYFVYSMAPVLFPSLESNQNASTPTDQSSFNSDNEEEEEEELNETLYSEEEEEDADDLVIQFGKEKDEEIPLEEPQDEKYDIVNVGTNVLEKWAQVEGYSDTEIEGIKTKYVEWLSSLTDELVSNVGRDSSNDYIFWKKMATSTGWPNLANVASIFF